MTPEQVGTPPEGNPARSSSFNDQMHIMQSLMEVQRELGALSTKTERLIRDLEKCDQRGNDDARNLERTLISENQKLQQNLLAAVGRVEDKISVLGSKVTRYELLTLGGFAVLFMVGAVFWWTFGGAITAYKDRLVAPLSETTTTPAPGKPRPAAPAR